MNEQQLEALLSRVLVEVLNQNNKQLSTLYKAGVKNITPMEYHGNPTEDIRQWAFQMEIKMKNANIAAGNHVVRAVEGFRGHALAWYMQNSNMVNKLNWSAFVTLLVTTFEPAGRTALLCQEL